MSKNTLNGLFYTNNLLLSKWVLCIILVMKIVLGTLYVDPCISVKHFSYLYSCISAKAYTKTLTAVWRHENIVSFFFSLKARVRNRKLHSAAFPWAPPTVREWMCMFFALVWPDRSLVNIELNSCYEQSCSCERVIRY